MNDMISAAVQHVGCYGPGDECWTPADTQALQFTDSEHSNSENNTLYLKLSNI